MKISLRISPEQFPYGRKMIICPTFGFVDASAPQCFEFTSCAESESFSGILPNGFTRYAAIRFCLVSRARCAPGWRKVGVPMSIVLDGANVFGSWPQFFNLLNASLTHINNPNPDLVLFGPSWPEPDSTSDRLKGCVGAFADPSSAMKASLHFL